MRPNVQSTALAFLAIGAVLMLVAPLGILHVPAIVAGIGLVLRLRYAWWIGLGYAAFGIVAVVVWVAIAFATGRGSLTIGYLWLPVLVLGMYTYLLVSLLAIRRRFFD